MKKLVGIIMWLGTAFAPALSYAQIGTIEQPIVGVAAPERVLVSTYQYTNVITTTTRALSGLSAVLIDVPASNSAAMYGHVGNCTSTAVSVSLTLGPIEIQPSSNGGFILLPEDMCLWLVSLHTSVEYVTVQGVKQKR
jgi:hypothetical protein